VPGSAEWLIEIVSIRASDAVKRATHQTSIFSRFQLSPDDPDPRQRPEAEMIRVEEKIVEKVWANGLPTKFPEPRGAIHLILVDMRGYLDHGGTIRDYQQTAYGWFGLSFNQARWAYRWEIAPGRPEPIKGLFEEGSPLPAARLIQERIHFVGFDSERAYREGEIRNIGYYIANWHLFSDDSQAREVFASYPLQPSPS
jgi:hypothetical protein